MVEAAGVPLIVAAGAFLVAYAVPILAPTAPDRVLALCRIVTWLTSALFTVDLVVRVLLVHRRWHYLVRHG